MQNGFDFGDDARTFLAAAFLAATFGGQLPENPLRLGEITFRLCLVLRVVTVECSCFANGISLCAMWRNSMASFHRIFFNTFPSRLIPSRMFFSDALPKLIRISLSCLRRVWSSA